MKHILIEIFVVLNSSFIVRKPFRKRGYFLWIFLANLRGYWVVRCGQSVRLCRSARLWVDFGELRCSWPDGGQKIELPTGGQEGGRDWAQKSSFSTFTATASCKYDIFQNPLAKITSGSSMACKVFTSPPCGLNLPGCLIRRGYFVLSTARIFVWIAPGFLSTRDTRKCIKRFPNRVPNPSLVVFYLRQIHNLLASDIFTTIGKS